MNKKSLEFIIVFEMPGFKGLHNSFEIISHGEIRSIVCDFYIIQMVLV